jgi:hypothetical protein
MTITHRIADTPPVVDLNSLQMLLDEKKTALVLGVSLSFLRKSRCEGTHHERTPGPRCVEVGKRIFYRPSDLKEWVDNLASRQII